MFTGLSHQGTQLAYLSYQPETGKPTYKFHLDPKEKIEFTGSTQEDFAAAINHLQHQIQRNVLTESLRPRSGSSSKRSEPTMARPYQNIFLYPKYDHRVLFDEYHLSQDMRRTIKSIIPYVNTVKKTQIRVFSLENQRNFTGAPLILIDGIPIESDEALAIDPRTIQRVEVINKRRSLAQIGNVAQFGVLSFVTKNGFDQSNIGGVQKVYIRGFDNIESSNALNHRENFSRAFYWNPRVDLKPGTPTRLQIRLPEYYLELLVSIVGTKATGEFVYYQSEVLAN